MYHPSFVIVLVMMLGFFGQLHINLPYLLIEYKMISIRHKETRRQYRLLSYYCTLVEKYDTDIEVIDRIDDRFDALKNSTKLMQIERLKQHCLFRYNMAFYFSAVTVAIGGGLFVQFLSNDFGLAIVWFGAIAIAADMVLICVYLCHRSCWKPMKKRKQQKKRQQQKEFDEWKLKRSQMMSTAFLYSQHDDGIKVC